MGQAMVGALQSNNPSEQQALAQLLHWCYSHAPHHRGSMRRLFGAFLAKFRATDDGDSSGVPTVLQLLTCIIRGFRSPATAIHKELFQDVLLGLHAPIGGWHAVL